MCGIAGILRADGEPVPPGLVDAMDSSRALEVLRAAPHRTSSAILLQMVPERREALLQGLPEAEARRLKDQMLYAPDTAGGMMVRRLLPASIAIPVVAGGLIIFGARAGLYEMTFAVPLCVVACIVVLATLIWRNSKLNSTLANTVRQGSSAKV